MKNPSFDPVDVDFNRYDSAVSDDLNKGLSLERRSTELAADWDCELALSGRIEVLDYDRSDVEFEMKEQKLDYLETLQVLAYDYLAGEK